MIVLMHQTEPGIAVRADVADDRGILRLEM